MVCVCVCVCGVIFFCLSSLLIIIKPVLRRHLCVLQMKIIHSDFSKCLSEATGTYFLVLTVGCNVMVMSTGGALSIGSMLMCMIFALGSVSGAHFNPAVSVAIWLSGRSNFGLRDLTLYFFGQLVGACIAGLCYEVIFQGAFVLKPVSPYTATMVMAVEVIYSTALCFVVLNVATTKAQAGNQYFGLAIGFCVVSAAVAIGNISNCCLNPAVAVGSLIAALVAQGKEALGHYTIYFLMPFLGALFAVMVFYLVRRKDEYDVAGIGPLVVVCDYDDKIDKSSPSAFISPINKTKPEAAPVKDESPTGTGALINSEDES